jgi:hypothetical protein
MNAVVASSAILFKYTSPTNDCFGSSDAIVCSIRENVTSGLIFKSTFTVAEHAVVICADGFSDFIQDGFTTGMADESATLKKAQSIIDRICHDHLVPVPGSPLYDTKPVMTILDMMKDVLKLIANNLLKPVKGDMITPTSLLCTSQTFVVDSKYENWAEILFEITPANEIARVNFTRYSRTDTLWQRWFPQKESAQFSLIAPMTPTVPVIFAVGESWNVLPTNLETCHHLLSFFNSIFSVQILLGTHQDLPVSALIDVAFSRLK